MREHGGSGGTGTSRRTGCAQAAVSARGTPAPGPQPRTEPRAAGPASPRQGVPVPGPAHRPSSASRCQRAEASAGPGRAPLTPPGPDWPRRGRSHRQASAAPGEAPAGPRPGAAAKER